MPIKAQIHDAQSGKNVVVNGRNAMYVSQMPEPPLVEQKSKPFVQFLTDDGTATGSSDMTVDGSVTTQEFWVQADNANDRYITTLSFLIAGTNAKLSQFGSITALTNGLRVFYNRLDGETTIADPLQTNFAVVRFSCGTPAFGSTNTAFRAGNVVGAIDAFFPCIQLTAIVPPFGIKLDAGTQQKLVVQVRDDLTGVTAFDVEAFGFDRLPD